MFSYDFIIIIILPILAQLPIKELCMDRSKLATVVVKLTTNLFCPLKPSSHPTLSILIQDNSNFHILKLLNSHESSFCSVAPHACRIYSP